MTFALAWTLALVAIGAGAIFLLACFTLVAWDWWKLWRKMKRKGLG